MQRLVGIDAARGLAVLGMFAAHVGFAGSPGSAWLVAAQGRSAAVFALLAGVSMALMSGGQEPVTGEHARLARLRIALRAGAVGALGYFLVGGGTPIAVILPSYAVMFLLTVPLLLLRPLILVLAAGAFAVAGPALVAAAGGRAPGLGVDPLGLLLTGYYPAAVWMTYVLTGLAVGRVALREPGTQTRLVVGGGALAIAGYGLGGLLTRLAPPDLAERFSTEPHSGTTPEVLGNLGVALAVVGLLLAVAETRIGRIVLAPVAATGALALTVYTGQIVAIAVLGPAVVFEQTDNGTLIAFTVVTVAACTVWFRTLGRGPLERGLRALSAAATPRATAGGGTR